MTQVIALLQTALALLSFMGTANVPEDIKTQAVVIAQTAINMANEEIAKIGGSFNIPTVGPSLGETTVTVPIITNGQTTNVTVTNGVAEPVPVELIVSPETASSYGGNCGSVSFTARVKYNDGKYRGGDSITVIRGDGTQKILSTNRPDTEPTTDPLYHSVSITINSNPETNYSEKILFIKGNLSQEVTAVFTPFILEKNNPNLKYDTDTGKYTYLAAAREYNPDTYICGK